MTTEPQSPPPRSGQAGPLDRVLRAVHRRPGRRRGHRAAPRPERFPAPCHLLLHQATARGTDPVRAGGAEAEVVPGGRPGDAPARPWSRPTALLADRLPRRRLLNAVTAFFIICLVAFYALIQADVPIAAVFFLWVGIFNLMIVAQFWSFANDLYTKEQGERLFAIVAVGASLGAVLGA